MGRPEELNRRHWDDLARVHGEGDALYDVEALAEDRSPLGMHEAAAVEALGGVDGLDVLHLQCHLGFDAVRLARLGARVTGADFSPGSVGKARAIAERCGVDVAYVEADATALPEELHGRFDVVWATIGVLNWIGDLGAWMRSAAAALRPGGRLSLVEIHPLYVALGSTDPVLFDFPYADVGPVHYD